MEQQLRKQPMPNLSICQSGCVAIKVEGKEQENTNYRGLLPIWPQFRTQSGGFFKETPKKLNCDTV